MTIKEIKQQIHLLTTVKLMLEIDNRKSDWKIEDEKYLNELRIKLHL